MEGHLRRLRDAVRLSEAQEEQRPALQVAFAASGEGKLRHGRRSLGSLRGDLTADRESGTPRPTQNRRAPNPHYRGAEDPSVRGESGMTPGRATLFEPEPVS